MVEVMNKPETFAGKSAHIKTIGVVGAGQMGHGIAEVMAHKGEMNVIVQDMSEKALEFGAVGIEKSLQKFVSKEVITSDKKAGILSRLRFENSLDALKEAD